MTKKYRLSAAYKTFLFYSTVKRPTQTAVLLENIDYTSEIVYGIMNIQKKKTKTVPEWITEKFL